MTTASCPNPADLNDFLAGRVVSDRLDDLAEHLECCASCLERLNELSAEDEVVQLVQEASLPDFNDPVIHQVRQRWQTVGDLALADLAKTDTQSVSPHETQAGPDRRQDEFPFLSNPVLPDEMGRLGRYRILDVLGKGGMGIVFRAEDANLKREVALKVLIGGAAVTPQLKERFAREARTLAAIDHPGVVRLYAVDEFNGIPFLAMQLLDGQTLAERIQDVEAVEVSEVLQIGEQIADALAATHAQQIIHRDIKPSNIWIDSDGHVKLIDFGLAWCNDADLTSTGQVMGTPRYMSPEQVNGEPATAQSDLFSLGAVLYQLAVGETPFKGENLTALAIAISNSRKVPPATARPHLDRRLCQLIERLLTPDVHTRCADAGAVRDELRTIRTSPSGRPVSNNMKSAQRKLWQWIAGAVVCGLLVAAALSTVGLSGQRQPSNAVTTANLQAHQPGQVSEGPVPSSRERQLVALKAMLDLGGRIIHPTLKSGESLTYDDLQQVSESTDLLDDVSVYLTHLSDITDSDFRPLRGAKLKGLIIQTSNITGECLRYLKTATNLTEFQVYDCKKFRDENFAYLAGHRNLHDISALQTPVGNHLAQVAAKLPQLRHLQLGTAATDRAMDHLAGSHGLDALIIRNCPKITCEGVRRVADMSLAALALNGRQLNDNVVRAINAAGSIKTLEIHSQPFPTNMLSGLRGIELLILQEIDVTRFQPEALSAIRSLRRVRIDYPPAGTKESLIKRFRTALPHCTIEVL